MGGFKHTGVADGSARNHYPSIGQMQDGSVLLASSVSGTANAITASLSPAITAYVNGMTVRFQPASANTGNATFALNGLAVKPIYTPNHNNISANDLTTDAMAEVLYSAASNSGAGAWLLLTHRYVVTANLVGTIAIAQVADAAVTLAKMANIATDSLIGRDTASSGVPENITLNSTLSMTGAGALQRAALTGDVTAAAGSNTTAIANEAVTYAKMQNVSATSRVLGRITAGAGDPEELTPANLLTLLLTVDGSGSGLDADTLDGISSAGFADVSSGSFTGTLTGFTANPTGTINYSKNGSLVTLYSTSAIVATSNATSMTMTGLPAAVRPVSVANVHCTVNDVSLPYPAQAVIQAAASTITFSICNGSSFQTTGFTPSGTKGIPAGWQMTYQVE